MKLLLGFVIGLLLLPALAALTLATGVIDFSAASPPGAFEEAVADFALTNTLRRHAPAKLQLPSPTPEVLAAGLAHYRENCLVCHAIAGTEPSEIARGLNPPPPELGSKDSQAI
ncbi:MAG: c-type cytochrome, partial [Deltaproteobacteria bacterium]